MHLFYLSQKVSVTPNTFGDNIDLNRINFCPQCLPQYPTCDGMQEFITEDDGWMIKSGSSKSVNESLIEVFELIAEKEVSSYPTEYLLCILLNRIETCFSKLSLACY